MGGVRRPLNPAAVLLVPDVPPDRRLVQADGAHAAAPGPQGPVPPRDPPPPRVPPARDYGALALGPPGHVARAALRRDAQAYVHVVGAGAALDRPRAVHPPRRRPQHPADLPSGLAVQGLPPVLGHPHDAADALPARAR